MSEKRPGQMPTWYWYIFAAMVIMVIVIGVVFGMRAHYEDKCSKCPDHQDVTEEFTDEKIDDVLPDSFH